jgi:hypothetical protein
MKLRVFQICLSLVLLAAAEVEAQKISIAPTPSWVKSIPYSMEVADTSNTSGGYYDLLYEEQFNLKSREAYYHYAIKILTEKGLESNSSISESYDPSFQTLNFHSIIIHRNGQKISKLNSNDFQVLRREENLERLVYDGSLTAVYNITDLHVGDVLEYSFTYKGWNPAFGNKFQTTISLNYGVPIGARNTRIISDPSESLRFSYFNQAPQPVISQDKSGKYYEWSLSKLPALIYEDGTSSWYNPHDRVDVSSFQSWEEVAQWANKLYASSPVSNKALDEKIAQLKKISDKSEMLNTCIRFVQDEIRYLSFSEGIHGYKPHQAFKVFDQRFGDCKDKSVLLSFMINRLGFESHPVLVHSSKGRKLNERLPSAYQFDHCITTFNYNDSTFWVDPTISLQRGSLKQRSFPNYHFGLIIKESGNGLTAIPEFKGISKVEAEETFDVADVGTSATLHIKTKYYGDEANYMRDQIRSNSLATLSKHYLNFYANDHPDIKSTAPLKYEDNEKDNLFTTEEEYAIDPFWKYDTIQGQYSVQVYARSVTSYLLSPRTKIRTMPYSLNYPLNFSQRTILNMPENWSAESNQKSINSAGFDFTSSYSLKQDKKTIDLFYSYRVKKPFLEAHEIKEHVAKINEIYDNISFTLTYNKDINQGNKKTASPYYFIAIICLIGFVIGLRKLNAFDPEPRQSYEQYSQIGGWLILPAIGIALTPITIAYGMVENSFFDISQWKVLTDKNYAAYNPGLGLYVLFEFIMNIGLVCYSIFLCSIFVTRRTSLPLLMIIFYSVNLFLSVADSIAFNAFSSVGPDNSRELGRAIILAIIWIPYFHRSDRVKGTFIIRH